MQKSNIVAAVRIKDYNLVIWLTSNQSKNRSSAIKIMEPGSLPGEKEEPLWYTHPLQDGVAE